MGDGKEINYQVGQDYEVTRKKAPEDRGIEDQGKRRLLKGILGVITVLLGGAGIAAVVKKADMVKEPSQQIGEQYGKNMAARDVKSPPVTPTPIPTPVKKTQ